MRRLYGIVMFLLLASACQDDAAPPRFEELTRRIGCGDVAFGAAVAGRTAVLSVHMPDLLAQARDAGTTTTTAIILPDARVTLKLVTGEMLNEPCDDVGRPEEIDAVYVPVGGMATFTIVPDIGPPPSQRGQGSVVLDDLVLESERGDSVEVRKFAIGPVALGWLPG